MLEADGLVDIKPHKGAVVKPLSLDEIDELFYLRSILESDLLKRATPNMTDENFAEAQNALENYDRIVASGKNMAKWSKLNWKFHAALYGPAAKPISLHLVKSLHDNTDRYQRIKMMLRGAAPRAHNEHLEILQACQARQSEKAAQLMKQHILKGAEQVADFLKSPDYT